MTAAVNPMITTVYILLLLVAPATPYGKSKLPKSDKNLLEFALNLEYLESSFYMDLWVWAWIKSSPTLQVVAHHPLVQGWLRTLTPFVRNIISQFGFQEVGHLRAIKSLVPGFPRLLLNLSVQSFATAVNNAFGRRLFPPFDPYANDINYMLASYMIPYVGLTGYVGANPKLVSATAKKLVAGLLGVESGQDAVLRTLLYKRAKLMVVPYGTTVAEFTIRISELRNMLGDGGQKDEGLVVPVSLGVGGRIAGNLLTGDTNSLSYGRKPEEILRIVYGSGNEQVPGGFYPRGGNGTIARKYLKSRQNIAN